MFTRAIFSCVVLAAVCLTGCHRPHGAFMPYSGGSHTYYSTETSPKTVRLIDLRSNEVVFSLDIPAGKQLTIDFVGGEGDDPVYTPDLMRYEVFDLGTKTGVLSSAMSVPAAPSRRLDISLRQGPEYAVASPERELRTDEVADRPAWWTPQGGEMPEDRKGLKNYDD
jgi:hypothetical protein